MRCSGTSRPTCHPRADRDHRPEGQGAAAHRRAPDHPRRPPRCGRGSAATISDPAVAAARLALKRSIGSYLPHAQVRIVEGQAERIDVIEHLFREIAPRFVGRNGGYTRILKTGFRRGDNAEMCLIELVVRDPRVGAKTAVSVSPVTEAVRAEAPKSRSAEEPPAAV